MKKVARKKTSTTRFSPADAKAFEQKHRDDIYSVWLVGNEAKNEAIDEELESLGFASARDRDIIRMFADGYAAERVAREVRENERFYEKQDAEAREAARESA